MRSSVKLCALKKQRSNKSQQSMHGMCKMQYSLDTHNVTCSDLQPLFVAYGTPYKLIHFLGTLHIDDVSSSGRGPASVALL